MEQQQPVNQVAFPSQAPFQSTSPKSNLPLILIGVVLMILIGIGSYVLGTKSQEMKETSKVPTSVPLQEPTAVSTPTVVTPTIAASSSANWQPYISKDYHYEVRIPSGYQIDYRSPQLHVSKVVLVGHIYDPGLLDINFTLWDPATKMCTTDDDCFNILQTTYTGAKTAGSPREFNTVTANISGRSVRGIEAWSPDVNTGGVTSTSDLTYEYPMSLNGKLFELKFVINRYKTKDEALTQKPLVDQIISTFKFTN